MASVKFDKLKQEVSVKAYLEKEASEGTISNLKVEPRNIKFDCPKSHQAKAFSVNLTQGLFQCHCSVCNKQSSGKGIIDLAAFLHNLNAKDAALHIARLMGKASLIQGKRKQTLAPYLEVRGLSKTIQQVEPINKPLPFQKLKALELDHPKLDELGLDRLVLKELGIGYYPKKHAWLKDRIVIPIKNHDNQLLACLGFEKQGHKYDYPPADKFRQGEVLFLEQLLPKTYPLKKAYTITLIVVHDIFEAIFLKSLGVKYVMAFMGEMPSPYQLDRLYLLSRRFALPQSCIYLGQKQKRSDEIIRSLSECFPTKSFLLDQPLGDYEKEQVLSWLPFTRDNDLPL